MTGSCTGCLAGPSVRESYTGTLAPLLTRIGERQLRDLTAGELK